MDLHTENLGAHHPAARAGAPLALHAASIHIAAGEQVAVIGPSGAGKTTLLHALACALRPSSGKLALDSFDPWLLPQPALRKLRRCLVLATQVPPLPPRQRVVTSVLAGALPAMGFWQSFASLLYPQNISGAYAALEKFDLGEKIFERVDRLSGGERQRVGLARVLMSPAGLWLIDEPLSALDPVRAQQVMDTLIAEAKSRNVTLIMTLHQVEVALARFARIIGLRDGGVAFDLPTKDVTTAHLHRLYAQHEEELTGPAPMTDTLHVMASDTTSPPLMACR